MKFNKLIRGKLGKVLLLEFAVLSALLINLADLAAEYVAYKIYPVIEVQPVQAQEKAIDYTIAEHICLATNGENCDVLVNLARCESSLNPEAYHVNTNMTVDLGLFQWNSVHFKTKMTPKCALDVYCSARAANAEIKKGNGKIWVCWDRI
jgi:hypothetical protein